MTNEWQAVLNLAQANLETEMKSEKVTMVVVHCENCGKPADNLTRCNTCLFYWCDRCIGGLDHREQHRLGARSEERA